MRIIAGRQVNANIAKRSLQLVFESFPGCLHASRAGVGERQPERRRRLKRINRLIIFISLKRGGSDDHDNVSRHRFANTAAISLRYSLDAHSSPASVKALRAAASRSLGALPSKASAGDAPKPPSARRVRPEGHCASAAQTIGLSDGVRATVSKAILALKGISILVMSLLVACVRHGWVNSCPG